MTLQEVKQAVFLMKNGAVVEQMRAAGVTYKYNFGVILPQLKEIAMQAQTSTPPDELHAIAVALRADLGSRESQLLAPMLFAPHRLTRADALQWLADVPTEEVADVLCHALMRRLPDAEAIAEEAYARANTRLHRYAALRLMLNLLMMRRISAQAVRRAVAAELPLSDSNTALANRLTEELEFSI